MLKRVFVVGRYELVLAPLVLLAPGVAHAQCTSAASPQPTTSQTINYSDQTFDQNTPYTYRNIGQVGCNGASRGYDDNGDPGSPGQPAGALANVATNVTISGPTYIVIGGWMSSMGGNGGNGGNAGNPVFVDSLHGGRGGDGGNGGVATMNFLGTVRPNSAGGVAVLGLGINSLGGSGGQGGSVGTCCAGDKDGGDGGNGGGGALAQFTGSGQVQASRTAVLAQSVGGSGGAGGSVSTSDALVTNHGGDGGSGGQGGTASFIWQGGLIQAGYQGGTAMSLGGTGGNGGSARSGDQNYGGNGGLGGNAGSASVTMSGGSVSITETGYSPYNAALLALSEGGVGGVGGSGGSLVSATAGNGGAGGNAGAASASVIGTIDYTGLGSGPGHAIYVGSAGGLGGAGGNASAIEGGSGGGGLAGSGGSASLMVGPSGQSATINTTGKYANAAVVQSIGGGGGNGGVGSFLVGGGAGAPGGNGGAVNAEIATGSLVARGASASGLIAQSIGGGGGIGGDSNGIAIGAALSIGGNGGLGGSGQGVTVQIDPNAIVGSLNSLGDNGVLAQSIGGSGGAGGTAIANGSGFIIMTVGGDAGGGGEAGDVQITNAGLVTSYGDHAAGLQAQSVGGGGGKGGSAVSFGAGVVPTASVAIGGRGGSGGPAANATVTNSGQVTTYGSDAYAVVAQSIGGGGGSGGAAAARAVAIAPSQSFPAVSISVALGGAGGTGNTGATATASNSGIVTTAGEGAYALVAQSIGGGGGIGGDATAASYSGGSAPGLTLSVAVAIGGSGGTGATGGTASTSNTGLLLTYGADAYGVFAQSVGGGGGAGGSGDSSATASKAQASFAASLAVGGRGGSGGTGGIVNAASSGGIATNGDGADGMFAQSVGGGGGAAGGGTAAANGGTLTLSVGLGGSGGAGGDGGSVTASNGGAIVTRGTDAVGLLAQSVGGGGGKAGKAGATSGGVSPVTNTTKLFGTLAAGLNLGATVTTPIDGILKIGKLATTVYSAAKELYGIADQMAGNPGSIGSATSIDIGLSIGGNGGAAGKGGDLAVSNTGQISTFGAQSDGVFAQTVGGGGGKGGAASSTATSTDDSRVQTAIGLGGGGGAGGDGGAVSVINTSGAAIQTQGVLGFGVVAQSVGGGGGVAGLAGTVSGSLASLSVGVGGSGGAYGVGGNVKVTNDGAITTSGKHGIGILAQSVGGGGGLVRSMTTDETFDPADIVNNPQGRLADVHGLTLSFGGSLNTTGNADTTEVDVAGSVITGGRTAHAILAQSIGGGGGAVIGGKVVAGQSNGGTGNGDGNTVTVATTAGAILSTAGDGAYGILAQSIGGGGGVAGSLADVSGVQQLAGNTNAVRAGNGSGGQVAIGLTGTRLTTTGTFAPAIYAQSLGGGGGLIAQGGTLLSGGAGGSGSGNTVSVTLVNSVINASGFQSPGIVIQTNGSGGAAVSIDAQSSVTGGAVSTAGQTTMSGAVYIQQGSGNTITNAGTITGAGSINPTAVRSDAAVQIVNSGTITGAVVTGGNGSVLTNRSGGVLNPGATITLGTAGRLVNEGTLQIGGVQTIGTTVLVGDLSSTGKIVFDTDFAHGVGDKLTITGHADIANEIQVAPQTIRNARLALITASGGLTLQPQLAATPSASPFFSYKFDSDGTTLYVTPQAHFAAQASTLGDANRAVAGHLQSLFDSGERFDTGFTTLATIASAQDYSKALTSLTGNALGALAAQRYQTSRRFVSDVNDACSTATDTDCTWARVQAGRTTQDQTANAFGYEAQFQVFETGAQMRLADGLQLAGALAYEHSTLRDADATARIDGDSMLGAIGLHYRAGGLELVGSVDGGYGWYTSRRQITVNRDSQQASAAPRLWNIGMALTASYRMPLGTDSYLKPFAGVRGSNVHANAFAEDSRSVFALDVRAQNDVAVSGTFGATLGTSIGLGDGTRLLPFATAAIEIAGNTDWNTRARFTGESGAVDPFSVQTRAPRTFGRLGIGADLAKGSNFALTISYTPEFGNRYTTQQGVARLTYRF